MTASKTNASKKTQPVAIELLMADHRKVEDLFDQYESEKESDDGTKRDIADRICGELTVHAQIEEEIFYPWLRDTLSDDEMEMVEEAEVEHAGAKDLIAQIRAATDIDEKFDAKVKVLSEYIKHHVKEEEEEIFPEVRAKKEELDTLGQELAARKEALMEDLGLGDEGSVPPAARKGAKGSKVNSSSKSTR